MAELSFGPSDPSKYDRSKPWHRELTRYHWFVLMVAALGWVFDCLDQQLFNLARKPAMIDLLDTAASDPDVDKFGGLATSIFLIGWATGGIAFGILGDKIGRAKTMMFTILIYSLFTGLSALSTSVYDFALYRFLTGLGVGGEFAVGVALVAETMPERARPFALGLLQALSTVGNVTAALLSMMFGHLEESGAIESSWRWMFVVGTLPALLAIVIRLRLKEPERWKQAVVTDSIYKPGSLSELFGEPKWRKRAIVGMLLASAGVIGLWGIGFFSIDLTRTVFRNTFEADARAEGAAAKDRQFVASVIRDPGALETAADKVQPSDLLSPEQGITDAQATYNAAIELQKEDEPVTVEAILARLDKATPTKAAQTAAERERRAEYLTAEPDSSTTLDSHIDRINLRSKTIGGKLSYWAGITSLMMNFGAFFGIYTFSRVTASIGRRPAFAIGFIAAMISTAGVFWYMDDTTDVFWMIPIMGFCQLSLFGGYAIYFPELFPTRLRSTGTSFCYNVGRFVAAIGPAALGFLTSDVFDGMEREPMRYAGVAMCSIFLLGLIVLPFAPETKGQPLPE